MSQAVAEKGAACKKQNKYSEIYICMRCLRRTSCDENEQELHGQPSADKKTSSAKVRHWECRRRGTSSCDRQSAQQPKHPLALIHISFTFSR